MDDKNKGVIHITADKIVSYTALFIGLCALVVSIYEANIFRQQQKASVWPYLELTYSNVGGFNFTVMNKGVGPAIIKWVVVKIDGKPIKKWNEFKKTILKIDSANFIHNYINKRVISANEEVKILSFKHPMAVNNAMKNINRLSFRICYSSIFNDYWILEINKSGEKVYRINEYEEDSKNTFQN